MKKVYCVTEENVVVFNVFAIPSIFKNFSNWGYFQAELGWLP
jgi:hypothetical protein